MTSVSTSTRRPLLPALRSLLTPDVAMAMVVLLIIAMMIVPLPKQVLDLLISANLAASLLILLVSLYTNEPLQFAAFPSVLLLATLFRLGLNVLSTRLVLLQGDAGDDFLSGDSGDDALEGGLGNDVAVYAGNAADYLITNNGDGSWTMTKAEFEAALMSLPGHSAGEVVLRVGFSSIERSNGARSWASDACRP